VNKVDRSVLMCRWQWTATYSVRWRHGWQTLVWFRS